MGSNPEFIAQRGADIAVTRDLAGGASPCFPESKSGVGSSVH